MQICIFSLAFSRKEIGMATQQFPFGIDPAGFLPDPRKRATIEVEGSGALVFDPANEPLPGMVAQVLLIFGGGNGGCIVVNNLDESARKLTVTGWDAAKRHLTVRVNQMPGESEDGFRHF